VRACARLAALLVAIGAIAALGVGCRPKPEPPVVLATTTSVANSGLLDRLLPAYDGATVRALQVGSGVALDLLGRGEADVAITHAPEREAAALRAHPTWWYRKILYNDFLIVGPPEDPARIRSAGDAVTAMKRIADAGVTFISRGDESGTHERERQLWTTAQTRPARERLVVAGAGMGQTLRIASSMDAYTLTDRGTFLALKGSLRSQVLLEGDPRLLNTYAVVADPANARGYEFARWLAAGPGQRQLSQIVSRYVRGFSVWPADVPADRPESRPR